MSKFPERFKLCRLQKGLTQTEVGKFLNIAMRTVQDYEAGVREPRKQDNLVEIANFFGVSLDYLIGRTDDPAATAESPMPAGVVTVPIYDFSAVSKDGLDAPVSGKLPVLAELLPDAAGAFALRQDASFGLDAQGFKDVPVVVMCPVSSIDEDDKIYLVKHGDAFSLRALSRGPADGFTVLARLLWFVQKR